MRIDQGRALRYGAALLLTLASAMAVHALATFLGGEAILQRVGIVFVAAAVLFAAATWGRGPGLVAGVIGAAYAVLFFATFGTAEGSSARLTLGGAIGASILGFALLVGSLRTRADRALAAEHETTHALRAKAAELAETNAQLARANNALQSVNEGLEAFAYVVAHDLKEPVRAMAALLEDAESEAVKPTVRENVHAARSANERLAKLLSGLLEVAHASRLDSADLTAIHPLELLESEACAARYASLRDERSARIESSALVGTPPVLATEAHLCQILGNLILNAIKHNDKTSPLVRVRVAPQDADATRVSVTVEDDGPGLDALALKEATTNPRRGQARREGFGLVIVRRAVERLGGNLTFGRSVELGGASIGFTLPAATAASRKDAARDPDGAARAQRQTSGPQHARP